jgi:membrane protein DedA with SNARE-associated domain
MHQLPQSLQAIAPLLHTVTPYLDKYGYIAIFLAVMLEDFGLPVPGETMLIAGAIFSSVGNFHIVWILLLGICGAVIGDNIGYAIGYFGGRKLAAKYGKYFFLNEPRLRKVELFFINHGGKVVVIARFVEGLRQFNGIVAGIGKMRWPIFLIYNAAGAILWVSFWAGTAYYLGDKLGLIIHAFKSFELLFLAGLGILVLGLIVFILAGKAKRRHKPGND